jgi:hypothetical protein
MALGEAQSPGSRDGVTKRAHRVSNSFLCIILGLWKNKKAILALGGVLIGISCVLISKRKRRREGLS